MKRRTFIKSKPTSSLASGLEKANQREGLKTESFQRPDSSKIICGISSIDKVVQDFAHAGLVLITGPDERINQAFLMHVLLHQFIVQKKRVDYINVAGCLKSWEQNYLWLLNLKSLQEMRDYLLKEGTLFNFKTIQIDLGDPSNQNWKDYLIDAANQHPDSIIIDDVGLIEEFRREKGFLQQLRDLTVKVKAPIFICLTKTEGKNSVTRLPLAMISRYYKYSDVGIYLLPQHSTDFMVDGSPVGRRYSIYVKCWQKLHSKQDQIEAGQESLLEFEDYNLRFTSCEG